MVLRFTEFRLFYGRGQQKGRNRKTEKHFFPSFLARKTEKFSAFPSLDHTTPKMTNEHAGSAVAAVLAALKSPLAKK